MLIGSYNATCSRRRLWIYFVACSVIGVALPTYLLISSLTSHSRVLLVLLAVGNAIVWYIIVLATQFYLFLYKPPWRIELTEAEFRWHTVFRIETVPLSEVRVIRRQGRKAVWIGFDGRRPLVVEARRGGLGTFADDIKTVAPHVTIVPSDR